MEIGKLQELKITKMTEYGARLGDDREDVLLPAKEVPKGAGVGQSLLVFVCRDSEERLVATVKRPVAEVGQIAYMKVNDVTKFGAFLDWGLGKDLFLPYREQTQKVKPGDVVLIRVYVDKSMRLCGSMRLYEALLPAEGFVENDMVRGVVYDHNPEYGAFVAVEQKYHGMIPEKEIVSPIKIGDTVNARIKRVRDDGKIELSLRDKSYLQIEKDADIIYSFIKKNGGNLGYTENVSPEKIKNDFCMSKGEFKRAIGRLLKEKKIIIGENDIFLSK